MLGIGRIQFLDFIRQRNVPFTAQLDDEDFRMLDDWRSEVSKSAD
jgi:hypothetical protein